MEKEKFEGNPQPQEEIRNVDSIDQIKAILGRGNFIYKGQLYHKLNEAFIVKAKIEGDKVLGDGTALSIEDIDKNNE